MSIETKNNTCDNSVNTDNVSAHSVVTPSVMESSVMTPSVVTPWEVKGSVDYMAMIKKFGTNPIDGKLIQRWEKVTKMKAHRFLRRGLVFSHQDLDEILNDVESGRPVYIYTGRGPSSESMHLGHMVPFMFTKYLQDALNCIVVIQMSDDEKFFFKEEMTTLKGLDYYNKLSRVNAKDIIACGFDPEKTFIFSNLESNQGSLYFNNTLLMKATSANQIQAIYGLGSTVDQSIIDIVKANIDLEKDHDKVQIYQNFVRAYENKTESNSVGQSIWPCFQCGPAYCTSFTEQFTSALKKTLTENKNLPDNIVKSMKKVLGELCKPRNGGSIRCLVPMAIDQAPYFRMARDHASKLGCLKPAVIHSEFLPGLKQSNGKMSSTTNNKENSTLFLDMKPKDIKKLIKSHAFSGGGETLEEHQKYGGNISVDISYQYLTYFLESDKELRLIAQKYTEGTMTSAQMKEITSDLISSIIENHQEEKSKVTPEIVAKFFDRTKIMDIGGVYKKPDLIEETDNYGTYGINFDRTFGFKQKEKVPIST